ncbi:hypothetical protein HYFRA_00001166 [Hymenoscyphus fraxineus]|uniref:Threonine aspartase n=1 Tax=Hymenoscyphus fraxineus TaxID=746836 RepID=A0A9N9KRZ4_9HELO|nr:hypothetical protein HYFRA_00001166 [Hymenoscyphus fraxineus]
MQNSAAGPNESSLSTRFTSARNRLRQFSRRLSHPFRKSQISQAADISTSPSLSIITTSQWSVIAPPPIKLHPLPAITMDPPSSPSARSARSRSSWDSEEFNRIWDDTDGAAERTTRKSSPGAPVCAIFVHAGAGYHSTTNEHIHLGACNDAAKIAMRFLKGGGSATDAVEAAIRCLEDKEITNAGFGSNLSIQGIVECDATIVDHLGRSGACGATAQIRNPIHLARTILDASNKPLSLRRVPPNLLVGDGATEFASSHGIPVVPNDFIISKNARDRFIRWREDLDRAEKSRRMTPSSSETSIDRQYEERLQSQQRRDHMNAIMHGTWNEGQPDSPQLTPGIESSPSDPSNTSSRRTPSPASLVAAPTLGVGVHPRSSSPDISPAKRPRHGKQASDSQIRSRSLLGLNKLSSKSSADTYMTTNDGTLQVPPNNNDGSASPPAEPCLAGVLECQDPGQEQLSQPVEEDMITDTVGAIAIDMYGNIAAGSSSGGIGMKHSGRVGPAALVGIGTAVVPVDANDPEGVSVAAVTSGTGEHMATTMASQKCADRLYHNTRRARSGQDIIATDEEAMESFVIADFMGHPGVIGSNSAGAIGVMAVKKSIYGYFLHFAHNTDSFALASMTSTEREPKCVMSRLGDFGQVVRGGRRIRID